MGVAVPRRYISIEDLATARGVDPAKYTLGLGAREMAVAEPGEDTVALAALAAKRALDATGHRELGMLVVGTETGVDHSKPVASYVHGLLGLPTTMRVFDTQHACYGGTAGVMAAMEWIASGAAAGRAALVVCSDIARYGMRTAGEPTQGAGAVAMVIAQDPAMLELDVGISGAASTHVHDFWRPLGQREAQVDGHYSMQCYTEALATAYRGWKTRAIARELVRGDGLASEQLAQICYHVPFCKMARKAHVQVRQCDASDAGIADTDAAVAASFTQQVEPSLSACSRVGNIYTGSLYLALLGALDIGGRALAGKRVGMFSYGSGCTSEFFSGVVGARAADMVERAQLAGVLADRERITIDEYERIMTLVTPMGQPGPFLFTGVAEHRREYARG